MQEPSVCTDLKRKTMTLNEQRFVDWVLCWRRTLGKKRVGSGDLVKEGDATKRLEASGLLYGLMMIIASIYPVLPQGFCMPNWKPASLPHSASARPAMAFGASIGTVNVVTNQQSTLLPTPFSPIPSLRLGCLGKVSLPVLLRCIFISRCRPLVASDESWINHF